MEEIKGLILYSIELDGCINGVYTNNAAKGEIYNEIAKKRDSGTDTGDFTGVYDCFYFSGEPDLRNNAVLEIVREEDGRGLHFTWSNLEGVQIFEGFGYVMNPRQVVVSYTNI